MAEIIGFAKKEISWLIMIRDDYDPDYEIKPIDESKLLVCLSCRSWDQVDGLRRQAEQSMRTWQIASRKRGQVLRS